MTHLFGLANETPVKRVHRSLLALFLAAFYTVITMTPLAPLAMRSAVVAHAITGECVGDCAICGCSPERSANHTCCCWQKKLKHEHDQDHEADCCKKKHRLGKPVLTCNCPCGSNKPLGLWGGEKFEQLPYRFNEGVPDLHDDALFSFHCGRPQDRLGEPPDPPPKLSIPA